MAHEKQQNDGKKIYNAISPIQMQLLVHRTSASLAQSTLGEYY